MATEGSSESIYAQVDNYDWDNDSEFQGGLQAILGSAASPEQVAHLTLRARTFYYSRKFGHKVDFDGYQAWRKRRQDLNHAESIGGIEDTEQVRGVVQSLQTDQTPDIAAETASSAPAPAAPHGNAPTPASFAEICQLIAEGKPIPGIKEIPDTVLEGQATASTVPKRRKPWEKDVTEAANTESHVAAGPSES